MTPEQMNRETQNAAIIQSELLGKIYDGVRGAMADIHRRVIDEPWFGRTTFDVTYERQTGDQWQQHAMQGQGREPLEDRQGGHAAEQDGTPRAEAGEMDNIMQGFYGKEQTPGQQQDRGMGYGIEP